MNHFIVWKKIHDYVHHKRDGEEEIHELDRDEWYVKYIINDLLNKQ